MNELVSINRYSFIYDDVDDSGLNADVDVNDFVINALVTVFVEIYFQNFRKTSQKNEQKKYSFQFQDIYLIDDLYIKIKQKQKEIILKKQKLNLKIRILFSLKIKDLKSNSKFLAFNIFNNFRR